ncbi:hypothetical protein JCM33374_g1827 [Metschnikowia sp. JCM 33374]|nr:hypothetical protein JCM33374_g1827 [Metschnikowia sp. JCM 33374]
MSDLEDFEAFLEDDFDPIRFAASLLQATNVVDDTELDLSTPLKKLQFDVNECNKRMESLSSTNHKELLYNVDKVEVNRKLMDEIINPSTARLKTAFDRINKDVITPYEDAVKLNDALQRIHQTCMLLRGSSFFLVFLQQLTECEKSLQSSDDNREVIRLAKTYKQLASFFSKTSSPLKGSTADLLSLRLIRDYGPLLQVKSAEFIADLTSKISNDMGHHSSFNSKNTVLQNNLLALYIMDSQEFTSVIDRGAMTKSIQIALAQLTRSLQSPRTLAAAFSEVKQSSANFSATLSVLFDNCKVTKIDPKSDNSTLLDVFLSSLSDTDGTSVEEVYWSRLAFRFKKSVAATMARGGPIARNLRSQYNVLLESATSALEGYSADQVKDALSLIGGHN